jgi:FkbM family methyltransferase
MKRLPEKSYSQNGEDTIINKWLNDNYQGLVAFLDIGAYNGITFSNTYAMLEGENVVGIYYEPDKAIYKDLVTNLGHQDHLRLYNEAVGLEAGVFKWYDSGGDMVGTINPEHAEKWGSQISFQTQSTVNVIDVAMLLERHGDNFTFINVDVEGFSGNLFLEMFPKYPNCRIWCVEYDDRLHDIKAVIGDNYEVLEINGENIIFAKK